MCLSRVSKQLPWCCFSCRGTQVLPPALVIACICPLSAEKNVKTLPVTVFVRHVPIEGLEPMPMVLSSVWRKQSLLAVREGICIRAPSAQQIVKRLPVMVLMHYVHFEGVETMLTVIFSTEEHNSSAVAGDVTLHSSTERRENCANVVRHGAYCMHHVFMEDLDQMPVVSFAVQWNTNTHELLHWSAERGKLAESSHTRPLRTCREAYQPQNGKNQIFVLENLLTAKCMCARCVSFVFWILSRMPAWSKNDSDALC